VPRQTAEQARYVTQQQEEICMHTAGMTSDMSRMSGQRSDGLEQTATYTNTACTRTLTKTSSLFQSPLKLFKFHCGIHVPKTVSITAAAANDISLQQTPPPTLTQYSTYFFFILRIQPHWRHQRRLQGHDPFRSQRPRPDVCMRLIARAVTSLSFNPKHVNTVMASVQIVLYGYYFIQSAL
jgi:hypothetical protein